VHFPVALKYVPVETRYPPGWTYTEKEGDVQLSNASIQETWKAMESLVHKGLAKSIGVSNFQGSLILDLLRYATIRPATLQIEHHPYLVQPTLLQLAKSEGIAVTAYSSFGPQSFIELEWQKAKDTPVLFEHPVVTAIAERHKKTPAQVLLRWATQRGLAVIPKSNNAKRLSQNLEVTGFDLDEKELESISGLDRHLRFNNPTDVSFTPVSSPASSQAFSILFLVCGALLTEMVVSWNPTHLCLDLSHPNSSDPMLDFISSDRVRGRLSRRRYGGKLMISRIPSLKSTRWFYISYVKGLACNVKSNVKSNQIDANSVQVEVRLRSKANEPLH
jgi:diketogulonate reductase-like aldo/keto reductase